MTIQPHYRDLALENRIVLFGKLKPKDVEQFKDFINSLKSQLSLPEAKGFLANFFFDSLQ